MSLLEAESLVLERSGRTILSGVSFRVEPGETVAVVGPSGSGKTSLLTALAGIQRPDAGEVRLHGKPRMTPGRAVALVLQGYGLLSLLTAAENIQVTLRAAGERPTDALSEAERALEMVGLGPFAGHLVEELSGGQQQRVAVARALALWPQVLLADEPTAEQDPAHRELVVERLLHREHPGGAVVIATHDPQIAARCDRVVEVHQGRVVQPGAARP
ncbi:MAG TPA: ATP-binding cassette domain-containing protein [Nocardioidaceae bacterium]|nr:ATP-binding cassette domain-containing protein [Nocardioidaceae bacterium]